MLKNKKIYIIGFMGSGKSTVGKKLAPILGWSFHDLDKIIEENTKDTIPGIFSKYGEEYFRKSESEALRNLEYSSNAIISTGGGAPCYGGNMDFMLETGLTIYLKLTPIQLNSRLLGSKTERPLIKNIAIENLLEFITEKLSDREKCYSRAEIIIDGYDLDINNLLTIIKTK